VRGADPQRDLDIAAHPVIDRGDLGYPVLFISPLLVRNSASISMSSGGSLTTSIVIDAILRLTGNT
jgi:hypothetical protein